MAEIKIDTTDPLPLAKSDYCPTRKQPIEVADESSGVQQHVPGYSSLHELARGSSGTVFIGRSNLDGTSVAIKIFHKELIPNAEALRRFEREVKTLSRLCHPNIVKIITYGTTDESSPFIVMELVDGVSIRTVLDTKGVFEPHRTAVIGRQICHALETAHAQSFIHRDLKPNNILIDSHDVVKIIDLGIAKVAGSCNDTITEYGAIIGTPAYMSPEQCLGQRVDQQSDIYSLGCTLFEMLTGTKAFQSTTSVEAIAKQIAPDRSHVKLRLRSIGASKPLQSIVIKCLERNPLRRYKTVAQLDYDLSAFLLGIPLSFACSRYNVVGFTRIALLLVATANCVYSCTKLQYDQRTPFAPHLAPSTVADLLKRHEVVLYYHDGSATIESDLGTTSLKTAYSCNFSPAAVRSFGNETFNSLDATSIVILLPTMVLLILIIAVAYKKKLF